MTSSAALRDVTEKEFMRQVSDLARIFGWRVYHPWLSIHSERGWPDLALVKPPRLILAELKRENGRVSPHTLVARVRVLVLGAVDS